MSGIRNIGDFRRRKDHRLQALDTALDATLAEVDAARGQFDAELAAARALALSVDSEPVPAQALVTLRAGLAARDGNRRSRRSQWVRGGVPGAVAASVVGLLAYVAVGERGNASNPSATAVATAAQTIQVINQRMAKVQSVVAEHNRPEAQASGQSARQALVQAQLQAASLPPTSGVRDLLLSEAYAKIAQLTQLLSELKLSVAALPPVPAGSAAAVVGSASTTSSSTTSSSTTSTSSSTTSTTAQTGSSTTTTSTPGSTTTTSTTPSSTTTTTNPSESTTTSTTTTTLPGSSGSGTTTTSTSSTTSTLVLNGNNTTDNGTTSNASKSKLRFP